MTGKINKNLRKTLAGLMALWLSGFVFLVVCHAKTPAMADSCPLVRMGTHCDKADKQRDAERVEKQSADEGVDCCAFLPAFFDKTRSSHANQLSAVAAPSPVVELSRSVKIALVHHTIIQIPNPLLSKNDTFILNRSFRL